MDVEVSRVKIPEEVVVLEPEKREIEVEKKDKLIKIFNRFTKRTIDIVGSLVGIILLVPVTIGIYIARKVLKEEDGPLFYEQLRIGKNGKMFCMYKFRSMVIEADEKLFHYLEENDEAKEEYQTYKKLKNDPRITKVGKIIRKASLDEFPQFINVLKGEMSLVGPRPYLPREKKDMKEFYDTIVQEKPGITGYWQIRGRSDVTFQDRLQMDQEYIQNHSLKTDFHLLCKTLLYVGKKEGAI